MTIGPNPKVNAWQFEQQKSELQRQTTNTMYILELGYQEQWKDWFFPVATDDKQIYVGTVKLAKSTEVQFTWKHQIFKTREYE